VNPSTAFGTVLADELVRCGLREAVLAPGSRSAPLAFALFDRASAGDLRLHVRIDERSAGFLALGLAKASRRPVALVCTSGTAAAQFHAAVIEADESGVPLIVLTADRPPELRGTGANQAIDQLKLYGPAVRWFCEAGVPEARPGMAGYWRSLACRSWALASGEAGGFPGPVHVNVPLREPLVPGPIVAGSVVADSELADSALAGSGVAGSGLAGSGVAGSGLPGSALAGSGPGAGAAGWPEPLSGRPGGARWTSFGAAGPAPADRGQPGALELDWTERGVVVCGDGADDTGSLIAVAQAAGWPLLAEPSSNTRHGPNALSGYGYLLGTPGFVAAHRPDLIISAGRPGLSRAQLAFLRGAAGQAPARHVVLAQGPGRWADPARSATDVVPAIRLAGSGTGPGAGQHGSWLESWRRADAIARRAADAILDADNQLSEPRLARDLAAALPGGSLLWVASSLPARDLDLQMTGRAGVRVLASRGASGIDGLVSSAIGAALAHQAAGGGPAFALLGDIAFLHDSPGLQLGPDEPRPDLCLVVANNDGGGIFSTLEQARFPAPFERIFGTPHGADLERAAQAAGLPYACLERPQDLPGALAGRGLRVLEVRTSRADGARLRDRLRAACSAAVTQLMTAGPG
jgi:2-succinyl-5-enolpyruvyl-6-hydroxy-3-cyclohexene-1-carboxylate synthase